MDETAIVYSTDNKISSNASDSTGEESSKSEHISLPADKRICLVGAVAEDAALCKVAHTFDYPVLTSDTGADYLEDDSCLTIFILELFEGPIFDAIHKTKHRILGPTALQQLSERKLPIPTKARPLYSLAMTGVVVCFTGFRKKEELTKLIMLIHNMGGSIRKDMGSNITHLIANAAGGEKYQYALTFRVHVMSQTWVHKCWEDRKCTTIAAVADECIAAHKLKPFFGTRICFLGFPPEEQQHMSEVLIENGGEVTTLEDVQCTHVVVDEGNTSTLPEPTAAKTHIVKAEWFWKSIQNEGAADEQEYLFEEYLESLLSPSRRDSHATPGASTNRIRKRKRLHETINSLVHNETNAVHKRRSSISDAGLLSVSASFLDCTGTPEKAISEVEVTDATRKNLSTRQQVFLELVQTESNYVNILHTIMNMFKSPLEEMLENENMEALLNNQELKIIFGNLPPIYEIHRKMLEELRWNSSHWTEDTSIGDIFIRYSPDLVKAYPPFVNFFETMKDMLVQCDIGKPRFHAFLKICQTKPECGRQSLQELLIRPVQRLPSISLLLNDILKHTGKNNPDHAALGTALEGIKEVMTHINEDKRKTDAQLVMFDIFNDIDNCPPHLVSSHRHFITRCEVMELSEGLSGRGDNLILYLFSDVLEVCKKRSKVFNSLKSPNTVNSLHSNRKPYKHIKLMSLSNIKRVIDIKETEDCHNVFALMCRSIEELKEKLYSFTINEEHPDKLTFLRTLCRQMANTVCKTDSDRYLVTLEAQQLEISTSDVALGTLSKAFKFATRTRMKVGRAFSFNKTPSKLKRAMSTMMSPFGSTTNLTPASQLAQMRLASCNNINELGTTGSVSPTDVLVAPMSVQPTRKAKCSSISSATLRRL